MPSLSQLHSTYTRISSISHLPTRRLLLQSFRIQLLSLEKTVKEESSPNEKQQITYTNCTNTSSASALSCEFTTEGRILPGCLTGNDELVQLQTAIVEKQQRKYEMNEQIEAMEEEYLNMEETVLRQQEMVYKLEKDIARKSYEIGRRSMERQEKGEEPGGEGGSLASKIICFWF